MVRWFLVGVLGMSCAVQLSHAAPPPSFAPRADYPTAVGPSDIALGDLNGDGIPDMVVSDYDPVSNKISVRLGTGAGAFGPKTDYATGINPFTVAIGNLNAGGVPDVVVSNWSGSSVSVFLGAGGGALGAKTDFSTGSGRPIAAHLVDLNLDGKLDIILCDWSTNQVKVLAGNGLGGFGAATSYAAGSRPYSLALGDLNADGRLDVVVANRSTTLVSILLGQPGGGFGAPSTVIVGSDPISVELGDLDGDGDLDLACANFAGNSISRLLGTGTGSFNSRVDLPLGASPLNLVLRDMDQDGHLDVVTSYNTGAQLTVLSGTGTGAFLPPVNFNVLSGPNRVTVADVNLDGRNDIAVATSSSATASVLLNTTPAPGQAPSAANSTCPGTVRVSPDGTCCFDVVVRDLANNPIPGSSVVIDFQACPLTFCLTQPPGVLINLAANTARVLADSTGKAHICVCVSTSIAACTPRIYADGVLLCPGPVAQDCLADTVCTPGAWKLMSAAGPSPRSSVGMASNQNHGLVVLFGGLGPGATALGDTWIWDGLAWSQVSPVHNPSARYGQSMAYDYFRDRIVLFGGRDGAGVLQSDTWEWDGNDWLQVIGSGPSARTAHSMAYDFRRKRIVLFGGTTASGSAGDTWEYAGTWAQVGTTGPSARSGAALAFDLGRERIVLFGGDDGAPQNDTWVWDGVDWEHLASFGTGWPTARSGHAMAYGNECNSVVMFGGTPGTDTNTRAWNGAYWVDVPSGPALRRNHAMAYDLAGGRVMLFGGLAIASGDPLADTWEWCSPCNTPLAPTDSLGNVMLPSALDLSTPYTIDTIDHSTGYVSDQFPQFTPDNSWYSQIPCDMSLGGDDDPADEEPELNGGLDSLGINVSVEEALDSLSTYDEANYKWASSQPPFLPTAGAVGLNYTFPTTPHCVDPSNAFGGRDIIFIHGLRTTPIIEKILSSNPGALIEWHSPTQFPGSIENPAFYGDGYWKAGAERYWQGHIQRFLKDKGYKNRYLIVAWPATQRLDVGVHAILTQIADAMQYGIGVVDLSGKHDCSNFGTPGFVVVSHSTGGLITPVALRMAQDIPALNAQYIAQSAKAQVALNGAAAGSQFAAAAVGVGRKAAQAIATLTWECQMVDQLLFQPLGYTLNCSTAFPNVAAIATSVLVDLCPSVAKQTWAPVINSPLTVHTVTLGGGHPSTDGTDPPAKWSKFTSWLVKRLILTGLDDGVNPLGSQTANSEGWPPGYSYSGSKRQVKDLGLKLRDEKTRMKGYFRDQWKDVGDRLHDETSHKLVTIGANQYVSPWGAVQVAHSPAPGHDPDSRLMNHFSFMEGASHHYGATPGSDTYFNDNDYENTPPTKTPFPHPENEINDEETLAITDNAVFARYGNGAPTTDPRNPHYVDSAPLLEPYVPRTVGWITGRQIPAFKITVFGRTWQKGPWWLWYRLYHYAEGWENKVLGDYAYECVLREPPPPCTPVCCVRPPMGMVAWWPGEQGLDPAIPDVTPDAVAPRVRGILTGGAAITSGGKVGTGLRFDGVDDHVQVPSRLKLQLGTAFTIQAWVYAYSASGADKVIVDKGGSSSQSGYGLRLHNGHPALRIKTASCTNLFVADASPSLVDSCWHHIVVTRLGSTAKIYVDGTIAGDFTGVCAGSLANSMPLEIGGLPLDPGACFSGIIDEVAVWNRALSPAQISSLWAAGTEGMCRESWWVPSTILATGTQARVRPVICNFTPSNFTAHYTFAALPAGGACTAAGPTAFSPAFGAQLILAGQCTVLPQVTLTLPAGMVSGARSCYQMHSYFRENEAPACYQIANGRVVKGRFGWDIGPVSNTALMVPNDALTASTVVAFDFTNTNVAGSGTAVLPYRFTIIPTDGDTTGMAGFRLNGLPTGVSLDGSVSLSPGATSRVSVTVDATNLLGGRTYDVVVSYDLDGDTVPDAAAVVGLGDFLDQTPVDVGPAVHPTIESLRWVRANPNPFTESSTIEFELGSAGRVDIEIYDIAGRQLRALTRQAQVAGLQRVVWDGRDEEGRIADSGVYMVRIRANDRSTSAKVLLVRQRR